MRRYDPLGGSQLDKERSRNYYLSEEMRMARRRIAELERQLADMRLQRDMIALNRSRRDNAVFIVMDGRDVVEIVWDETSTGFQPGPKYPSYYTPRKDGG